MTLDSEALVVAAYLFADEYPSPFTYGRPPLVSDAELVALAVGEAAIGISSDRQFRASSPKCFPVGSRTCPISPNTTAGCGPSWNS